MPCIDTMHTNKLAILGVSVLLLFGCVLAAGCGGNEQADPMVDYWICSDADIGNGVIVDMYAKFNADGTGTCVLYRNGELYQNETVVWKNLGNGSYQFAITAEGLGTYVVDYVISSDGSSMSDESGRIWYKSPAFLPFETTDGILGNWMLKTDTHVTLKFENNGHFGGKAPINSYSGSFIISGNSLSLGDDVIMTLMAGSEEEMAAETIYLQNLSKVASYTISNAELLLNDENGQILLTFIRG